MKTVKANTLPLHATTKQVVVYARVSSEEQTKGNYPSCESQVEELVAVCKARGWGIERIIKDEGYSAGSLKRPGISEIRSLIEGGHINAIVCTWYDRLTRSRDFYVLDKEFKQHGVQLVTLHDATDTQTASGRFMESMLVAAKTYEREQTSEKIRSKLQMRAEKGMWNGGLAPFGFLSQDKGAVLVPDPEKRLILNQLFQVYVETGSDFKVRDWLQAHQVPSPGAQQSWAVSTIRKLLINRRYIAQIELNRDNKDREGVPESKAYRVVSAPHEPLVPVDLFELAQRIRAEKGAAQPNRKGRPRSYSQTQCQRVYPLQGLIVCAHCGHSMAPWYVRHRAGVDKSGKKRKNDSFIYYYLCAGQQKNWKGSDHKNCISAKKSEDWVLERLVSTMTSPALLASALRSATDRAKGDLAPIYESLQATTETLRQVEQDIAKLVQTASSGQAVGALWEMLNERAFRLQYERDQLLAEQRRLKEKLAPAEREIDAEALLHRLQNFEAMQRVAEPEEIQRLMRLLIRRIEWAPQSRSGESDPARNHKVQFFVLPKNSTATNLKTPENKKSAGSLSQQTGVSYCDELRWI
jgi:site-specific DNA recombinase